MADRENAGQLAGGHSPMSDHIEHASCQSTNTQSSPSSSAPTPDPAPAPAPAPLPVPACLSTDPLYSSTVSTIVSYLVHYGVDRCALSFNGGKDCTALLSLMHAALTQLRPDKPFANFPVIYFKQRHEFPAIEHFLSSTAVRYGFQYTVLDGDFIAGLKSLLDKQTIAAIFMGQRKGDPGLSGLSLVASSSPDWPAFDRVNPLIEWDYGQIWKFLKDTNTPYCELYDQGYTSIGNSLNSHPNPALADALSPCGFKAAWQLKEFDKERDGRGK